LILTNEQMMAVPIRETFGKLRAGGVEKSPSFAKATVGQEDSRKEWGDGVPLVP
jgi:hypothetical protein